MVVRLSPQVLFGEVGMAAEVLDEEGVEVFKRRGLSLLARPAKADPANSTPSKPTRGRLFSLLDRGRSSSRVAVAEGSAQPEALLHVIAPSTSEAQEWKAAFDVSGSRVTVCVCACVSVHVCMWCPASWQRGLFLPSTPLPSPAGLHDDSASWCGHACGA